MMEVCFSIFVVARSMKLVGASSDQRSIHQKTPEHQSRCLPVLVVVIAAMEKQMHQIHRLPRSWRMKQSRSMQTIVQRRASKWMQEALQAIQTKQPTTMSAHQTSVLLMIQSWVSCLLQVLCFDQTLVLH